MSTRSLAGTAVADLLVLAVVAGFEAVDWEAVAAGRTVSREQAASPRIIEVKRPKRIVSPCTAVCEMQESAPGRWGTKGATGNANRSIDFQKEGKSGSAVWTGRSQCESGGGRLLVLRFRELVKR